MREPPAQPAWWKVGDASAEADRYIATCTKQNGRLVGEPSVVRLPTPPEPAFVTFLVAGGQWWKEHMSIHGARDGWRRLTADSDLRIALPSETEPAP